MKWKNMKIGTKIILGFGAVLFLLSTISAYSYLNFRKIARIAHETSTQKDAKAFLLEKEIDHLKWIATLSDMFLKDGVSSLTVETDDHKCGFGKWLHGDSAKAAAAKDKELSLLLESIKEPHRKLHESAIKIGNTFKAIDKGGATKEAAKDIFEKETLSALSDTQQILGKMKEYINQKTDAAMLIMDKSVGRMILLISCASVSAIFLGILAAFIITRGITKPMKRIIAGMGDGASQVASASGQVSSASQSLAEGTSEQAASVEETSSSLEEMSSMTKQNADNASQADNLMKEANRVVGKSSDAMKELTSSMADISRASEETAKIIKTIDEIAFQTNLLALNAAVEAARAGEAGAGFAVVADEVRNLAMRAADAAKNTADLIEGTVKKVKDGSAIVTRANEAFSEVATSTGKVGELVGEIAAASNEQARGIEQINKAISEMDKVIQQNAASAEESASASEEMNAQAEQMKMMVGEMVALVEGSSNGRASRPHRALPVDHRNAFEGNKSLPARGKSSKTNEVRPRHVISLDGDDFADF